MVRASLDELAGQLAAPHFRGGADDLCKEATAVLSAARRKDLARYAPLDIKFHLMIVEGASNRILLRIWDSLALEVRIQFRFAKDTDDLVRAQEAHWSIIEALEKGDGKRAGSLLRNHVFSVSADLNSVGEPEHRLQVDARRWTRSLSNRRQTAPYSLSSNRTSS